MTARTLLLVEDDDDFAELVGVWIRKLAPALRIFRARTAADAIREMDIDHPDLVLADLFLGASACAVGTGEDVVQAARRRGIRALTMSGSRLGEVSKDDLRERLPAILDPSSRARKTRAVVSR